MASILCPVDFSDSSRGALRYARVLAEYSGSPLIVATVIDPLLQETARLTLDSDPLVDDARRELERFCDHAFDHRRGALEGVQFRTPIGQPAAEILRLARADGAALIVMSSSGLTGFRKLFFGSIAERVLRETSVPVLVTPAADGGPADLADVKKAVRRVLMPVDLASSSDLLLEAVGRIASALDASVLLVHVVEPLRAVVGARRAAEVDRERRARAEQRLESLVLQMPKSARPEALVAYGEPAEEIAKTAGDRGAGLIVLGLHASPLLGQRMGSVTYRVLCLAQRLVLAVPPSPAAEGTDTPAATGRQQPVSS